ncbi:hypothetical protein CANARDRAFT_28092 [[Candida] arabinofermentans NRRL YB-2248]|uniref:Uncharacterized protein n=1 Tax=[Candida] arabinofermentans NRRL YB-2248 TaxID=983967 RepID=A0A1E4T2S3_9ASCO|nr:hypothetical protein CANARDRAFT_28092 [[Candida] arabinofermentans NRRL YB-2248]
MRSNLNTTQHKIQGPLLPRVFSQSASPANKFNSRSSSSLNSSDGYSSGSNNNYLNRYNGYNSEDEFDSFVERDRRRRLLQQNQTLNNSNVVNFTTSILPVTTTPVTTNISTVNDSDPMSAINNRINERVNKLFHPLRQQHQQQQQNHSDLSNKHSHSYQSRQAHVQQLRSNKRNQLQSHHRGNMEEYFLRQGEDNRNKRLEFESQLQTPSADGTSIDEFNRFLQDNEEEYDADYDSETYFDVPDHRKEYTINVPGYRDDFNGDLTIDESDNEMDNQEHELIIQRQLEEMLMLEQMEIEELTKNLNLNG